ncbi:MAG: TFIIB-type zinc ribbon-containing protein [Sulfolobales archaeon]
MECPYCRAVNSLVWDEIRGMVVCSECGVVVDLIYVSGGNFENELEPLGDRVSVTVRKFGKLSDASIKYLTILKEIKYRPQLYVDSDSFSKYLVLGKRVKVIKRRISIPKNETIEKIVTIIAKYPRLCSRTDRAKYALATIAYALATEGSVDSSKLSKQLGLSKTHIRRLLRVVRNSQRFLDEVRKIAQANLTTVSR